MRYRFAFNGKENDNEVKGTGNQQDYGFRIYDPRLGRFLSIDPLTAKFPMLTPYQFGSNNPIQNIDLDGLEGVSALEKMASEFNGYRIVVNLDNVESIISKTEVTSQKYSGSNLYIKYNNTQYTINSKGEVTNITHTKNEAKLHEGGYNTGISIEDRKVTQTSDVPINNLDPIVRTFSDFVKNNPESVKDGDLPNKTSSDITLDIGVKVLPKVVSAMVSSSFGSLAGKISGYLAKGLMNAPKKEGTNKVHLKKIPLENNSEITKKFEDQ